MKTTMKLMLLGAAVIVGQQMMAANWKLNVNNSLWNSCNDKEYGATVTYGQLIIIPENQSIQTTKTGQTLSTATVNNGVKFATGTNGTLTVPSWWLKNEEAGSAVFNSGDIDTGVADNEYLSITVTPVKQSTTSQSGKATTYIIPPNHKSGSGSKTVRMSIGGPNDVDFSYDSNGNSIVARRGHCAFE